MTRRLISVTGVLFLAVLGAGCVEHQGFTTDSGDGQMAASSTWYVEVNEQVTSFPDNEDEECNAVDDVRSTDPTIVEVRGVDGCTVQLHGVAPGEATIEFSVGWEDGEFDVRVEDVDRVETQHNCTLGREAAYLGGTTTQLPQLLFDADGDPLSGLLFPFNPDPANSLDVTNQPTSYDDPNVRFYDETREITLVPTVDGETLTAHVIQPDDIDGIELWAGLTSEEERPYSAFDGITVGDIYVSPTPMYGDVRVCTPSGITATVTAVDPEVCRIRTGETSSAEATWELGTRRWGTIPRRIIVGDAGDCVLDMELTDAENVTLVQQTFEISVKP